PQWRENQDFAYRDLVMGYEMWHRTKGTSAYGLVGDLGMLHADQPRDQQIETRSNFTTPSVSGIINGHVPYLLTERLQYSARFVFAYGETNDDLRRILQNQAAVYIDGPGDIVPPSEFFTPDEYSARTF